MRTLILFLLFVGIFSTSIYNPVYDSCIEDGIPVGNQLSCHGHANCYNYNGYWRCVQLNPNIPCENWYDISFFNLTKYPETYDWGCSLYFYDPHAVQCIGVTWTECCARGHWVWNSTLNFLQCQCDAGWSGYICGNAVDLHNCSGHGHIDGFICVCNSDFYGDICQYNVSIQCSGHGTFVVNPPHDYCSCDWGYTGSQCEYVNPIICPENLNESRARCGGRGICINDNLEQIHCLCDAHWGQARSDAPCDRCDLGHTGIECNEYLCDGQCHGHGLCIDNTFDATFMSTPGWGICQCDRGWDTTTSCTTCAPHYQGPNCEFYDCSSTYPECNGHGRCTSETGCSCDVGYLGEALFAIQVLPNFPGM